MAGYDRSLVQFYESDIWGEVIRPGGFRLTERLVELLNLKEQSSILDLGCGKGETMKFLAEKYKCRVYGTDLSFKLLRHALTKLSGDPGIKGRFCVIKGKGEEIPFRDESFDGVICECTLTLSNDKRKFIHEMLRVLKAGGAIGISDFYLKLKTDLLSANVFFPCIAGAEQKEDLIELFSSAGFRDIHFEDHSSVLKDLIFDMIFGCGSLGSSLCRVGEEFHLFLSEAWRKDLGKLFSGKQVGYCIVSARR